MNTRTPADWKALFESDAFAQQNTYTGPLGVEYTPAGTRLRLWAPTARQVYVNLYRRGDGGVCIGSLPLEKRGQGLWSVYLPGDQHGHYYTYTLHAGDTSWEAADPYARAAGVNGKRSMIADFARIDPPAGCMTTARRSPSPTARCGRSTSGISPRTRPAASARPGGANIWPLPSLSLIHI